MAPSGPGGREAGTHPAKALALVVVVVLVGWLVLHHSPARSSAQATATTTHHSSTASSTTVASTTTTTTPLVPPSSIKLQVLNGVLSGPLAGQWSNKLKQSPGYDTLAPDNATSKVSTSAIYVMTARYLPEAKALASVVGLPPSAINTTVPAPSSAPIPSAERANANLVLVIGPDLANKA